MRRPPALAALLAPLFAAACLWMAAATPAAAQDPRWAAVTTPSSGPPEVIGTYTNGCIAGAVALPAEGTGYQVIRLSRNRFWGHPDTIAFVQRLGEAVAASGLAPLLVADMGQPRGGPITGHASHEIGLDVDIWLRRDVGELPRAARESLSAQELVGAWEDIVRPGAMTIEHAMIIRGAASDPRVGRVLVHPAIKRALCEIAWDDAATDDREWLRRVRPWTGHNSHMHIRLTCPAGSTQCVEQAPPPPGDGCGAELMSWFPMIPPVPDPDAPPPPPPPPLPVACEAVLTAP